MYYENVELHNVAEVTDGPNGGVCLQRVPEHVREKLNERAREMVLRPACGEIRFVSDGPSARVTLSAASEQVRVVPFFGTFRNGSPLIVGRQPVTFEVTMPDAFRQRLPMLERRHMPFSPRVCRLMLWGGQVCFYRVEGEGVRSPSPAEVPRLRYLSYGTSITHGAAATWPHLAYVAQVARRLGADLLNLGMGGSCHCEPELADYIARRTDWHVATLALSVNMMGFSDEEFRERVTYMVNTVARADHSRPVACITLFRYFGDRELQPDEADCKADDFRQILRDVVAVCPHPNVCLLEGREMLTDFGGLTTDLIHPADDGMMQMAENIARRLLPLVAAKVPDGRSGLPG